MDRYAPVALFVYNRPEHTRRTVEALQQNTHAENTELYIFADGGKPGASLRETHNIKEVREIIIGVKGFRNVIVKISEENMGLEKSIVNGINQVLEMNDSIIVLEDDIVPSKFFLSFCNQGLNKYHDQERVAGISGYMYPVTSESDEAFFLPTISCWGWATWKRSWQKYNGNAKQLLQTIHKNHEEGRFNLNNSYPYINMLEMKVAGKINSWAVCWYASIFNQNGLMLYPPISLVYNAGMDGSGTNTVNTNWNHSIKVTSLSAENFKLPKSVIENKVMQKKVEKFLRSIHYPKITDRIISKVRRSFQKFS